MVCFIKDPLIGSFDHLKNLAYVLRHKSLAFRFQEVFYRFKDLNYNRGYRLIQLRFSMRRMEYQWAQYRMITYPKRTQIHASTDLYVLLYSPIDGRYELYACFTPTLIVVCFQRLQHILIIECHLLSLTLRRCIIHQFLYIAIFWVANMNEHVTWMLYNVN